MVAWYARLLGYYRNRVGNADPHNRETEDPRTPALRTAVLGVTRGYGCSTFMSTPRDGAMPWQDSERMAASWAQDHMFSCAPACSGQDELALTPSKSRRTQVIAVLHRISVRLDPRVVYFEAPCM